MKDKINIIFPCAGKAERFGNTFKPFLKIGDLSFIEKAIEPFLKWSNMINKFYFIITEEQEEFYAVSDKFKKMFDNIEYDICFLKRQTDGPLETFIEGYINNINDESPFIVCDCDHSINVDTLFNNIATKKDKIIIPTWDITPDIQKNWSKILINDGKIIKFINKEEADFNKFVVKGIIGCIFFRNKDLFKSIKKGQVNFYEMIYDHFISGTDISLAKVRNAYFYGDHDMLKDCIDKRRNECTIFCDIDGVLLKHNDHSSNDPDENICLNNFSALEKLHKQNHKIVLTTARSKKFEKQLKKLLKQKNIYYDEILMSCKSGPRILINDRKPKKPFTPQATGIEVIRNNGLPNSILDEIIQNNRVKLLQDISANSFAKTLLIEKDGKKVIRKTVLKSAGLKHVNTLKRQMRDLERFNFLKEGLCPKILHEEENNLEFLFDMEYLENYKMLSDLEISKKVKFIKKIVDKLHKSCYNISKEIDGDKWLKNFLDEKIYPKFELFSKENSLFDTIINNDKVTINGNTYYGLSKCLEQIDKKVIKPEKICVVHGDLTLENIMINEANNDLKFIDMDGSRLFDARELDLGKMSQSILSRYDEWKNLDGEKIISYNHKYHFNVNDNFFNIIDSDLVSELFSTWSNVLNNDNEIVKKKSIFYMSTYFIRFVPFRTNQHVNHGVFALIMATVWLNKLLGVKNEN